MPNGLDVFEHVGEEYKRLVNGPLWTVASLNYASRFDPANFVRLERHLLTDETFVLLTGEATLVVGEEMSRVRMEQQKLYNIKAGVWHHIFVTPGTRVLVVENADTAKANTEYLPVRLTEA